MRTNNHGYKTAPELIVILVILAYGYANLDWDKIFGVVSWAEKVY